MNGNDLLMYKYKYEDEEAHYFHAHRGIELLYIYSGRGEIMAESRTYPIRDHTLVWFQPYQLHRVAIPPAPGRSYVRTNLTFDPGFLERFLSVFPSLDAFFRRMWKGHLQQPVLYDMQATPIPGMLEELNNSIHHAGHPAAVAAENNGLLMLQLLRLLQIHGTGLLDEPDPVHSPGGSQMQRITEWLDAHYKKPFRLDALAGSLHLSPYHVSHVFKQFSGITLSEYLMQLRIREACILLANTTRSVQEIAAEVGGYTPSYFSQMFKKHKGISPEQYRKSIR
ncbi:AraC family transcriptional regulator [Paenibacillus sp. NFR01]|uniref:helix-turn-helix transcriptional regulator n=1 Tax=Paenibacillus sp. NFR01 TaxID=1566279 RepID=UPI0008D1B69B|nr:AraC family transcriptional regulator [Paenibacillus sp. NFR01]SET70052.1 AraC-type DNA-binding protein [Paenibacillus sp. NFR01]